MDDKEKEIVDKFRAIVLDEKTLNSCIETDFLLKFLRVWNFDCDKSLVLLRNYYKLRSNYVHLYTDFTPKAPNVISVWKFAVFLPVADQNGRKILYVNVGKWDPHIASFDDLFIAFQMMMEVLIEDEEEAQLNGAIAIMDMGAIGFQHTKYFSFSNVKRVLKLMEDSFPLWFHAFHYVNQNAIFKTLFTLILPILSKSMRKKVFLHGTNLETLHEHVNPDLLPQELGGSLMPIDYEEAMKILFKYENFLLRINQFGYINV